MKIIKSYASGEYVEKKSRFIGEIFPVKTEDEVQEQIAAIRKKYYDARHHCYAYILESDPVILKQSDDGEPSQTAGMPILSVLQNEGLSNVLLVVTRYFGGTLLGTGGLVRSYTAAAKEAVANGEILESVEGYRAGADIPYTLVGKVKYLTENLHIKEEYADYQENVHMVWLVPEEAMETFQNQIQELSGGTVTLAFTKHRWYNA